MANEYTEEITCPYCGYIFTNSWEYGEGSGEAKCSRCGKKFEYWVNATVTYSTFKNNCGEGNHVFAAPVRSDVNQKTCDQWNAQKFLNKSWKPYSSWTVLCKNCKHFEHAHVELGGDCPKEISDLCEVRK